MELRGPLPSCTSGCLRWKREGGSRTVWRKGEVEIGNSRLSLALSRPKGVDWAACLGRAEEPLSKTPIVALAWVALLLSIAAPAQAQRQVWYPKQGHGSSRVRRILLLPPKVEITKLAAFKTEQLPGTADYVERTLCGNLSLLFNEKGVEIVNYPLCLGEAEKDAETGEAITRVQWRFQQLVDYARNNFSRTRFRKELKNFSLEGKLTAIKKPEVDALVVSYGRGYLTTKGHKVMSVVAALGGAGSTGKGLEMDIGVVDAQSGMLLYYCPAKVRGDFLKKPDRIEKALRKSMEKFFR